MNRPNHLNYLRNIWGPEANATISQVTAGQFVLPLHIRCSTNLEKQLVFSNSLNWFDEIGGQWEPVGQVELQSLKEGLALSAFID